METEERLKYLEDKILEFARIISKNSDKKTVFLNKGLITHYCQHFNIQVKG